MATSPLLYPDTGSGSAFQRESAVTATDAGRPGQQLSCRRSSAKGGLGCPVLHHEIKDTLVLDKTFF